MSIPTPRPLTDQERAQGRRWLDNWREIERVLEQERSARLAALPGDAAWVESQGLLRAWEADMPGDGGEGLLLQSHAPGLGVGGDDRSTDRRGHADD